ncbi:MAG TPA: diguanylate cyclase [Burkholderiales bacterium]|nr:diguanylate cyclase [Burkholderiales bacterium]
MPFSQDRFRELKADGRLPSPSGVALRLLELLRQEDVPIEDIAHAMQADPALSGRLIRFANMAFSGPRRPVVSVTEAIQRSGLDVVRQIVLGFSLLAHNRTGACRSFDYSRFWSRSLATAIAANSLCLRVRAAPAEEAFSCGLLADVGSLALATLYPKEFAALLDAHRGESGRVLAESERREFKTDHAELGAAMHEDWRLPRLYVEALQHHENPDAAKVVQGSRDYLLLYMLSLAAGIGSYCVSGEIERKALVPGLVLMAAKIGLDADVLGTGVDHVVAEWREWGKLLEVKTQDVAAFEQHARPPEAPDPDRTKPQPGAMAMSILIADDDPTIRVTLEHLLRQQGHRVAVAVDGREALTLAIEVKPQLVISDWVMPELDGVALCRRLRETQEGRRMYFILLTGMTDDEELVEGFEAGADDYVTKPLNARVLTARLRAAERVIRMQEETQRDTENLRKFATELALTNRRLQQAALTDALTGLPNRRHLIERLNQERAIASRNQRPFALMMIDVDAFKQVNDAHGHDAGDQLLVRIAALLRQEARVEDIVGRLGGDEFVVICPGANLAMGVRLADRLRQSIAQFVLQLGNQSVQVTISVGVSQQDTAPTVADDILQRADAALYRAKREGRNRVSGLSLGNPGAQASK